MPQPLITPGEQPRQELLRERAVIVQMLEQSSHLIGPFVLSEQSQGLARSFLIQIVGIVHRRRHGAHA